MTIPTLDVRKLHCLWCKARARARVYRIGELPTYACLRHARKVERDGGQIVVLP